MLNSAEHEIVLLLNVKMPTIVGIFTFISIINTISERLKAIHFFFCQYFSFMSSWTLVSWAWKNITSRPDQIIGMGPNLAKYAEQLQ